MLIAAICAALLVVPVTTAAQSNDNDFTPLNSRIKRDRQFPTELTPKFDPSRWTQVQKDRSKEMVGQFGRCIWRRSNEKSLDLIARTDFSFQDFSQIGMDNEKAAKIYGIKDCLGQVARLSQSGVMMRWSAAGMRQWLIEQAYLDHYPDGPTWLKPGQMVGEREMPLSGDIKGVNDVLDFADCVVISAPYDADLFYRLPAGSPAEKEALNGLIPALGPCLPQGVQMKVDPASLRVWLGEALWHASQNIGPVPAQNLQESQ